MCNEYYSPEINLRSLELMLFLKIHIYHAAITPFIPTPIRIPISTTQQLTPAITKFSLIICTALVSLS